jgi:hypothetical protein
MERIAVTGAAEFSGTASTKQLLAKAFVFHTTVGGRSAGGLPSSLCSAAASGLNLCQELTSAFD